MHDLLATGAEGGERTSSHGSWGKAPTSFMSCSYISNCVRSFHVMRCGGLTVVAPACLVGSARASRAI